MKTIFIKCRLRMIVMILMNLFFAGGAMGATLGVTYYLTAAGQANAQNPANWNTLPAGGGEAAPGFGNDGDIFIIPAGINGILAGNATFGSSGSSGSTVTLTVNGTLTINAGSVLTLAQKGNSVATLTVNGTISFLAANASQLVGTIAGSGTNANLVFNLAAGASLKTVNTNGIAGNGAFSINTNATTGIGTLSLSTDGIYEFNGAVQSTTGLPGTVHALILSNTGAKTLAAPVNINADGVVTISGSASLITAGNLFTLKSDATGTARIAQITSTAVPPVSGDVTVERYIKLRAGGTGRAYRLLTPTVNTAESMHVNWMEHGMNTVIGTNVNPQPGYGTHITGAGGNNNGFDVTQSNAPSVYSTTNGATPTYTAIGNTNGTLDAKTGYFLYIRGDRSVSTTIPLAPGMPTTATTLRTRGTLLTGDQSFTSTLSTGDGIMNLVTNPYASPISWTSIYADNLVNTNLKNYYTLWDPNVGTRGGFVTVTDGGAVSILNGQSGPSQANINIQSGQAFFVTSSGSSAPTLTIKESHKSDVNNNNVFLVPPESFSINLFFYEPNNYRRIADGVSVFYDDLFSPAVDEHDAVEINNWDENIAINRNGIHLAIESRPVIIAKDTLPLFMNNMRQQAYEFEFTPVQFSNPALKAELIDNYLNTRTLLSVTAPTVVAFTITTDPASKDTNRFTVVFGTFGGLSVEGLTIKAQARQNGVQVDWASRSETDMVSYEVERSADGTSFTGINTTPAVGNSTTPVNYSWFDASAGMGSNFYRIKAMDRSGNFKYSDIVKVAYGKGEPSIVVYPNPVAGQAFKLELNNLVKGTYVLNLYINDGRLVHTQQIQHDGNQATRTINLNRDLARGSYQLQIISDNGFKTSKTLIKN